MHHVANTPPTDTKRLPRVVSSGRGHVRISGDLDLQCWFRLTPTPAMERENLLRQQCAFCRERLGQAGCATLLNYLTARASNSGQQQNGLITNPHMAQVKEFHDCRSDDLPTMPARRILSGIPRAIRGCGLKMCQAHARGNGNNGHSGPRAGFPDRE
jgi:hypothetical protein